MTDEQIDATPDERGEAEGLPPAERLNLLLAALDWSVETAARQWRISPHQCHRWRRGVAKIKPEVLAWVDAALAWLEAHPMPDGRQRRSRLQAQLRRKALAREALKRAEGMAAAAAKKRRTKKRKAPKGGGERGAE